MSKCRAFLITTNSFLSTTYLWTTDCFFNGWSNGSAATQRSVDVRKTSLRDSPRPVLVMNSLSSFFRVRPAVVGCNRWWFFSSRIF